MAQQYSIFKLEYKKEQKTDYVRKIKMPPEKERKKPFECELCESSFASKHQLRKHVPTVHEEILSHLFDRIKPHCSYLDVYISQKNQVF